MFIRGLRTKIAFNIAILFFVAMLLVNIITVMTAQRDIIRKEVSKGQFILSTVKPDLIKSLKFGMDVSPTSSRARVFQLLSEAGVSNALVFGKNNERILFGDMTKTLQEELMKRSRKVMRSKMHEANFFGTTWGVFWKQRRDLILSAPLLQNDEPLAGASIVLPLEGIYQSLRRSQKMLFIYLFINTLILTFIGIYRLSKVYFQPLARLARRAQDYREDDDMLFSVRKEDNELHQLSGALNSMLRRISADKEKLRSTVNSLEKANLELKKAQKLEPLSVPISADFAIPLFFGRKYDEAFEQCMKTKEMDPNYPTTYWYLGMIYRAKSMWEDAIDADKKLVSLTGNWPLALSFLGCNYAASGQRDEALKVLDTLNELSKETYVSSFWKSLIYAGFGEKDEAFDYLEKALMEREPFMVYINNATFDLISDDPRFKAMWKKIGLE